MQKALEFAIREESAVTYIPLAELNLRKIFWWDA